MKKPTKKATKKVTKKSRGVERSPGEMLYDDMKTAFDYLLPSAVKQLVTSGEFQALDGKSVQGVFGVGSTCVLRATHPRTINSVLYDQELRTGVAEVLGTREPVHLFRIEGDVDSAFTECSLVIFDDHRVADCPIHLLKIAGHPAEDNLRCNREEAFPSLAALLEHVG